MPSQATLLKTCLTMLSSLYFPGCDARGVEVSFGLPGGEGPLRHGQHPGARRLDRGRLPDAARAQQANQIGGKTFIANLRCMQCQDNVTSDAPEISLIFYSE